MMTSGWFSILLTTMLAWSPPGESPEAKPVSFKLQDFRGAWHQLDDAGRAQGWSSSPSWGRSARWRACMPRGWPSWHAPTRRRASRSSASTPTSRTRPRRCRGSPASMTCRSRCSRTWATSWPTGWASSGRPRSSCSTRAGSCAIADGWTTSSASASTARRRCITTSPRRSTTCSPAGRSPRRGPSPPAAGSAGSPRAGGMRPSRIRSRSPASSATVASPATARERSRRSRWRRTTRPPAGPR